MKTATTSSGSSSGADTEKLIAAETRGNGMVPYFDKGCPLTISMWDFSWLSAHHGGGPFEDFARRVGEAAERGYNTLRIDCFPSHILEGKITFKKNVNKRIDLPAWGASRVDHEEDVLKRIAELAEHCRKNGLWLGLDSWNKTHMLGHSDVIAPEDEEKTFTTFSQTWVKALKLMREEGILERAAWISPMNEVPHFGARQLLSIKEAKEREENTDKDDGSSAVEEQSSIYRRINHWMGEAIADEVGKDQIPLSYSSLGEEPYGERLTDIYDAVDIHFMPELPGREMTRFADMADWDFRTFSLEWETTCRDHYQAMLTGARNYFAAALDKCTTPSGKKLTPIVTEAFGPCYFPDHEDVDWTWYKRYNADGARVIAAMPYAGTTLSNYAEPLFRLWDDVDWHRNSNAYIAAMSQAVSAGS